VDLAAVYSREIDGQKLSLAPSGWTYDFTFVLYDKETGTLWYPYRKGLKGIQGKYFQRWLEKRPFEDTRWEKWKTTHPGSRIVE
jgi:hypothetical protein